LAAQQPSSHKNNKKTHKAGNTEAKQSQQQQKNRSPV